MGIRRRARGEGKFAGRSAKASQLNADQEAWEANRMITSGVAARGEVRAPTSLIVCHFEHAHALASG